VKLACPHCGKPVDPEQLERAGDWRECWQLAARLGKSNGLVDEYAEHWRGKGGLTLKKKIRVYREVAQLLESSEFKFDGRRYRTDQRSVLQAIRETVDAARPPLRNHNYLFTILTRTAERLSAEGFSAKGEAQRERTAAGGGKEDEMAPEVKGLVGGMLKPMPGAGGAR
jgi:hypothetical protein